MNKNHKNSISKSDNGVENVHCKYYNSEEFIKQLTTILAKNYGQNWEKRRCS